MAVTHVEAEASSTTRIDAHRVAVAVTFAVLVLSTLRLGPWLGPWWGTPGTVVVVTAGVAAAFGNRTAGWVAVIAGVFVLAIPQWDGSVSHYHHLLWFAVVLLVGELGPWQRCLYALLAFIYLVPGLAKLAHLDELVDGGMQAIFDRVREQHGVTTWLPSGSWFPIVAAIGVTAIEVLVPVVLFTRWRRWALAAALSFHAGALWVLGIPFWALTLLFPIFFLPEQDSGDDMRPVVVTAAMIVLSLLAGQKGWPFATYPKFV